MGRHGKKKVQKGLRVDVRYNNIEFALKKMKLFLLLEIIFTQIL